jgi:hypothetical protein
MSQLLLKNVGLRTSTASRTLDNLMHKISALLKPLTATGR